MRRAMGIGLAMMSLAAAAPPDAPQPRLALSAPFGLPRGWQPDGPCPQPRLIARALWCTPPKR